MQIVKTSRYLAELEEVISFIAQDSLTRALEFADKLNTKVLEIDGMPYQHRASSKTNDNNVRELIFHGYVIPYRINFTFNQLEIIGIFSSNEWEL